LNGRVLLKDDFLVHRLTKERFFDGYTHSFATISVWLSADIRFVGRRLVSEHNQQHAENLASSRWQKVASPNTA
jgi:hypothetical protein